jgi:hypothetical protein
VAAKWLGATTLKDSAVTRDRAGYRLTGVDVRSVDHYRMLLSPACVTIAAEFPGTKDAFTLCLSGAVELFGRVAQNVCQIDINRIGAAESEFCVLSSEPIRKETPKPTYTNPLCHVPSRNCP